MPPRRKNSQVSSQDSPLPISTTTPQTIQESPAKRVGYNQEKHTPLLAFYLSTIFNKSDETKSKGISKKKMTEFFDSDTNMMEFIKYCKLESELKCETIKNKQTAIMDKLKMEKKGKKDKKEKKNESSADKGSDLNDLIRKAYFTEMANKFGELKKRTSSEMENELNNQEDDDGDETDTDDTARNTTPKRKKT
ncbi:predicted protein [Naegleria gruberi]|uniref:Predicted protein n=1 Tax=Naegleria gruberi TaxID=5762 RepID=D2VU42_NAEGR|nr:uncharacterized protein NAEGRDRAFT_72529 [Naegleria gruberi]EFC39623.1 predicted protein [Naegleria gruberi]|eukprot:XP_002672367.1 predicted protein [Naegleria gruberi strain NEG-M]